MSQTQTRDDATTIANISDYVVVGTSLGKTLIFNYRSTQCVAILVDLDGKSLYDSF